MMTPKGFTRERERLALSQSALARALGVSHNSVWRWEHGRYPLPLWLPLALAGIRCQSGSCSSAKK